MEAHWEHFDHDADVGLRGFGGSPAEAFVQAALALAAVVSPPDGVRAERVVDLSGEAKDLPFLLFDWLNGLIFEMAVQGLLFGRFEVEVEPSGGGLRLRGRAWGEPVDPRRHRPAVEVKGATMTGLSVRESAPGAWIAECVVDV